MDTWEQITATLLFRSAKFAGIFAIVSVLAKMIERRTGKKRLLGITIVGAFIVTGAVYDLIKFTDWQYYQFTFQGMPHTAIVTRYVFSLLERIALVVAGTGLLYLNNYARKAIIALAAIQIVIIPWKHPLSVFKRLSLYTQQQTMPGTTQLMHPWHPWALFLFFSFFDIAISSFVIYYFSRPATRKNFE